MLPYKQNHLCGHNFEGVINHEPGVKDGVGSGGGSEGHGDAGLCRKALGEPGQSGKRQHRVQRLGVGRTEEETGRVDRKEQGSLVG